MTVTPSVCRVRSTGAGSGPARKRAAARKGFLLRLPPKLMNELKRWAADDLRSINGQIEFLLTEAVKRRKGN